MKDPNIKRLENVSGVGRIGEKVDVVLAAESDQLEVMSSLMAIGEQQDVMLGIGADRVDLIGGEDKDTVEMKGKV